MPATSRSALSPSRTTPLRVKFLVTSLPVGGAEVLLLNLIKRLDPVAFDAEVVCLKEPGEMGAEFSEHAVVHSGLIGGRCDARVLLRLGQIFWRKTDAVITVGAGDKMFWGRLAARIAGVPVICSALHSTGWPDGVGRLNRMLTPITDGFIACAKQHAEYLAEGENFPADKVHMIPNGVDTERFRPDFPCRSWLREELSVPQDAKLVGIVAALRPEKNHLQFVDAAERILRSEPKAHFVIIGDGPERETIESAARDRGLADRIHLLGSRSDTPQLLAALDVFCLTSKNEANPVSILEALSTGIPVVSPDVGSINETVLPSKTGFLTQPLSGPATAEAVLQLLENPAQAAAMGAGGRELVCNHWSLDAMVTGYQRLIQDIYNAKASRRGGGLWQRPAVLGEQESKEDLRHARGTNPLPPEDGNQGTQPTPQLDVDM